MVGLDREIILTAKFSQSTVVVRAQCAPAWLRHWVEVVAKMCPAQWVTLHNILALLGRCGSLIFHMYIFITIHMCLPFLIPCSNSVGERGTM